MTSVEAQTVALRSCPEIHRSGHRCVVRGHRGQPSGSELQAFLSLALKDFDSVRT